MGGGVADEVAQHLGEPVGIGVEGSVCGLERKVALAEQRKVAAEGFKQVAQVDRSWLDDLDRLVGDMLTLASAEAGQLIEALLSGCAAGVAPGQGAARRESVLTDRSPPPMAGATDVDGVGPPLVSGISPVS